MKINKFTAGLIGLIFGILANSINVETSTPFRFNNPIPISKSISYLAEDKDGNPYFATKQTSLSENDEKEIVERRQLITDTRYNLRLFGLKIPIVAYRTVQDPSHFKVYSGRLDREGNIHTSKEVYELQSAHDALWYNTLSY